MKSWKSFLPPFWKFLKIANAKKGYNLNMRRLVDVWLDEFKELYYSRTGGAWGDEGDITERLELKEKLQEGAR